jgi:hypothetical protein
MCVHILHERLSNFANGQWKFGPDVAVGPHAPTQVSTKYVRSIKIHFLGS